ncbi:helix-turn-helix domain-containing protein [Ensifer adhaerens]|uniref:helix-turn-helix domain-containing protein n=1 Tax=Ensifer adhaerens TaxID=106592 RepID=UPI001CBCB681|nr:helix-turn-helix transcriptional regulator [Ensifer adhaerens]MBZ7924354.1 helix-turn-helix domain-containing protein [Ensifer adhaerens]UAX96397.1 helix-turn-helix domain-containing protein [Ensifer adhaerens]UAY04260.1 helix-turn-helix domain-containing protein [Ensifer adhaerens]UAY12246.1 helix-turn-helix domain-containing protein [Ensifer adhaerens]
MLSTGDRLKVALEAKGVKKQMAFAAQIGVNDSVVSRWKRGQKLTLQNAVRICQALDISLDWLVLGRGTMDAHRVSKDLDKLTLFSGSADGIPEPIVAALITVTEAIRAEFGPDR